MKDESSKERYTIGEYIGAFVLIMIFLSLVVGQVFIIISFIKYMIENSEVTTFFGFIYVFLFFMYILSGDWLDLLDLFSKNKEN